MHNTTTLAQVNRVVDKYVEKITTALSITIDKNDELALNQHSVPCDQAGSDADEAPKFAQRSYPINHVDPDSPKPMFATFSGWAKENGFHVDRSNEDNSKHPVSRATNKTGYKVGIDVLNGNVNLTVSSPCV